MCGIIGVYLEKITPEQLEKVANLIRESAIRGVHATGISCLQNGKINTVKTHLSATKLLEVSKLFDFKDADGGLYMIAHTRYSTSDLRYNQPIGDKQMAISHNGVISQADPTTWTATYGLEHETANDSELIYRCLQRGNHPFDIFDGSMAVCWINDGNVLHFFRNHQRPLWYCQELNGVVVASTKDILLRSGFKDPKKCDMFTDYCMMSSKLTKLLYTIPDGVTDLQ